MKDAVTTREAARRLGVTQRRVVALLKAGRLRGQQFNREWMVSAASVASYVARPAGRSKREER